jgi:DNA-binding transcriptional regulator YiaG
MSAKHDTNGRGARAIDVTQPNLRTSLQSKLKRWRKRMKLTQDQARLHLAVPIGTYRNWEQGRKPPGTTLLLNAVLARMKEPITIPGYNGKAVSGKSKASAAATARG